MSGYRPRRLAGSRPSGCSPRRDDLDAVVHTLNTRPRKTLNWRTPAKALDKLLHSDGECWNWLRGWGLTRRWTQAARNVGLNYPTLANAINEHGQYGCLPLGRSLWPVTVVAGGAQRVDTEALIVDAEDTKRDRPKPIGPPEQPAPQRAVRRALRCCL